MYLLWQNVCDREGISSDVRDYLIFHFLLPFEKAERECILINAIYDNIITKDENGHLMIDTRNVMQYKPKTILLLKNPILELDLRIADTQRIERLIRIINQMFIYYENSKQLSVLKKGLAIDNMMAFSMLYQTDLLDKCEGVITFVERASKRLNALPEWGLTCDTEIYEIQLLTRYCLDKELDKIIMTFLSTASQKGINPYACRAFENILTDTQHLRFYHLKNEYEYIYSQIQVPSFDKGLE